MTHLWIIKNLLTCSFIYFLDVDTFYTYLIFIYTLSFLSIQDYSFIFEKRQKSIKNSFDDKFYFIEFLDIIYGWNESN